MLKKWFINTSLPFSSSFQGALYNSNVAFKPIFFFFLFRARFCFLFLSLSSFLRVAGGVNTGPTAVAIAANKGVEYDDFGRKVSQKLSAQQEAAGDNDGGGGSGGGGRGGSRSRSPRPRSRSPRRSRSRDKVYYP
jgi:hypothetical protein